MKLGNLNKPLGVFLFCEAQGWLDNLLKLCPGKNETLYQQEITHESISY